MGKYMFFRRPLFHPTLDKERAEGSADIPVYKNQAIDKTNHQGALFVYYNTGSRIYIQNHAGVFHPGMIEGTKTGIVTKNAANKRFNLVVDLLKRGAWIADLWELAGDFVPDGLIVKPKDEKYSLNGTTFEVSKDVRLYLPAGEIAVLAQYLDPTTQVMGRGLALELDSVKNKDLISVVSDLWLEAGQGAQA